MKKIQFFISISMIFFFNSMIWSMENKKPFMQLPALLNQKKQKNIRSGKYDGTKSAFSFKSKCKSLSPIRHSIIDTIEKMDIQAKHPITGQEYGPGSDNETESRWERESSKISTKKHASILLRIYQEQGWQWRDDIVERLKIIANENQNKKRSVAHNDPYSQEYNRENQYNKAPIWISSKTDQDFLNGLKNLSKPFSNKRTQRKKKI